MIHSVALVIADFFVSKDVITEEEKEVCAYGMELIISGIISVALVLIIGLITGNIWYAVVYNIMMVVIRLYTGGYHADTHVGCNVCYCMAFIISMVLLKAQTFIKGDIAIWLVALAGYLIIVLNAPLEHHNKKLTMKQKHDYMIISFILGIASLLISFGLNIMGVVISDGEYHILCSISSYINIMLLVIGLLLLLGMRKEGRFHEKDT